MSNMVIPDEGKELLAQMCWGDPSDITEDFYVDLYTNDYTPDDDSTYDDFDIATFTGYGTVSVPRDTFGAPVIVAHVAVITSSISPDYECTAGAGQTCYGFVMWGQTSGKVYGAQLFAEPRLMNANATEKLTPFALSFKTFA